MGKIHHFFFFLIFLNGFFTPSIFSQARSAEINHSENLKVQKEHQNFFCERLILITGCGRSGTTYIAELLTLCGLDVPHEELGDDGCSSWYMAVEDYNSPFGPGTRDAHFKHIFHQVRHPLDVITSWFYNIPENIETKPTWDFLYAHILEIKKKDTHLVKCAKYWYYWNLRAEEKAEWRYKIEDMEIIFPEMCQRLGVPVNFEALHKIPKDVNKWKKLKRITWYDLKMGLNSKDFKNIQKLAVKYGYTIED
jgi:hypothetical protein